MLILLSGDNEFERSRYANALIDEFVKKHGNLGVQKFSFSDNTIMEVADYVRNFSFFNPIKLCVFHDFDSSAVAKSDFKNFLDLLDSVKKDESNVVLISASKFPVELKNLLSEASINKEFSVPENKSLIEFVQKEAKRKNLIISDSDASSIIDAFGNDLNGMVNEVDRLSLSREKIKKDDYSGYELFPVVSKLRYSRNRAEKMFYLEVILSYLDADAGYAFNLLSAAAPKSVKPEDWYSSFADYDVAVKSGNLNYEEALLDFALK